MIQDDGQRARDFKQLRWTLQGLAAAGSDQQTLFPDATAKADELASDFTRWASVIRNTYDDGLSKDQVDSLVAIDQKLTTMSRDGAEFDADLWTDTALVTSEHWAEVRRFATSALEAFGWNGSTSEHE